MTQRYFALIFIILTTLFFLAATYFFGAERIGRFIVIWVLCGFYAGQYSAKFRKG